MDAGLRSLGAELGGALYVRGDEGYARATAPRNRTARQAPAAVVAIRDAGDAAACVRFAAASGRQVAVQATGHGAAGAIDANVMLLDTSGLTELEIDRDRGVARVDAGVRSAQLNAAAEGAGLLAPTGTAPDVGVTGYTLYGGVGWLTRALGMASASLQAVDFVDGRGERHRADVNLHADALWAFRGGGGVGVVVGIELDLHPAERLWGGYALWPLSAAPAVSGAWAELVASADPGLSTVISTLRAPGAPEPLRDTTAVYLGAASPCGGTAAPQLSRLLDALPSPAVETFGDCDAARLTQIHLDPPVAVDAVGDGRWLHESATMHAAEIITAVQGDGEPALAEVELRHAATGVLGVEGALTNPPGSILLHAVGLAPTPVAWRSVERELAAVRAAAAPADTGRSAAPFRDGQTSAPGALAPADRERLAQIRRRYDPDGVFAVSRPLS